MPFWVELSVLSACARPENPHCTKRIRDGTVQKRTARRCCRLRTQLQGATVSIGADRLRPAQIEGAASVGPDRLSINHSRYLGRGRGLMAGKAGRNVVAHTSIAAWAPGVPTR